MIDHRHLIFVLAVVIVAKRDVTAVRSLVQFVFVIVRATVLKLCIVYIVKQYRLSLRFITIQYAWLFVELFVIHQRLSFVSKTIAHVKMVKA